MRIFLLLVLMREGRIEEEEASEEDLDAVDPFRIIIAILSLLESQRTGISFRFYFNESSACELSSFEVSRHQILACISVSNERGTDEEEGRRVMSACKPFLIFSVALFSLKEEKLSLTSCSSFLLMMCYHVSLRESAVFFFSPLVVLGNQSTFTEKDCL